MTTTAKSSRTAPAPEPIAAFDLDALEASEIARAYDFTASGRTWTASDPRLLPWAEYDALDPRDTEAVMRAMLGPEQYDGFAALALPKWKLDRLAAALSAHFDPDRTADDQTPTQD